MTPVTTASGRPSDRLVHSFRSLARCCVVLGAVAGCSSVEPPRMAGDPALSNDETQRSAGGRAGILVMAHGGSEAWNASVETAVEPLAGEVPVEVAFGMARRETLAAAVDRLESIGVDRIAVVRLFISGDSFLHRTEYLLDKRSDPPPPSPMARESGPPEPIRSAASIEVDPEGLIDGHETAGILERRALALSRDPTNEAVLVLGHGNGDEAVNQRLLTKMDARAAPLRERGFREVRVETLREDWAEAREEAEHRIRDWVRDHAERGTRVLVVPMRLSGFGPYAEVLQDLEYEADGVGLLPDEAITAWLRRRAQVVFCQRGWWESNHASCHAAAVDKGERAPNH